MEDVEEEPAPVEDRGNFMAMMLSKQAAPAAPVRSTIKEATNEDEYDDEDSSSSEESYGSTQQENQ